VAREDEKPESKNLIALAFGADESVGVSARAAELLMEAVVLRKTLCEFHCGSQLFLCRDQPLSVSYLLSGHR
jgi:hypothetical protein